jgi:hypothetical protein
MATVAALAFSACTFGDGTDNALDEVAATTRNARTAKISKTLAIARLATYEATGMVDFVSGRSRSRLAGFAVTQLIDGHTVYVRYGDERKWIRFNDWDRKARINDGDPSAWLAGLERANRVERLGNVHYSASFDGVSFKLWIDRQGRVRRIRYRDLSNASVTLRYSDFGSAVEIDTPEAASTMTLQQYEDQQRRQLRERCENPTGGTDLAVCNLFPEDAGG